MRKGRAVAEEQNTNNEFAFRKKNPMVRHFIPFAFMEPEPTQSFPEKSTNAAALKHKAPLRPHKHYRKTKVFFKVLGVLFLVAVLLALAWFLGTRI